MTGYVLYDIPSKRKPSCWSPNTWKTRILLNLKGVSYETRWVEYPDIVSTLSPNVGQNVIKLISDTPYSLPAIQLPDGSWVMDSWKIAERLEQDHPSPNLHLQDPTFQAVDETLLKVKDALRGIWLPKVPYNLLNDPSKDYFIKSREKRHSQSLDQMVAESGGEEAWLEALPHLKQLGQYYGEKEGPFVLGKQVSYADLIVVAFVHFQRVVDEDIYRKIIEIEPSIERLYEASKHWLARDSY